VATGVVPLRPALSSSCPQTQPPSTTYAGFVQRRLRRKRDSVARAISVGHQAALQALPLHQLLSVSGLSQRSSCRCVMIQPGAWRDADVVGTEIVAPATGEPEYAGLAAV